MANAVCENGRKCILVDSGLRSFSPNRAAAPPTRRLKQSNERAREFSYAMQINWLGYFKRNETKFQFTLFGYVT